MACTDTVPARMEADPQNIPPHALQRRTLCAPNRYAYGLSVPSVGVNRRLHSEPRLRVNRDFSPITTGSQLPKGPTKYPEPGIEPGSDFVVSAWFARVWIYFGEF